MKSDGTCLPFFTYHDVLKVHPCCCKWQDFHPFYGLIIPVIHIRYIYTHTHTHTSGTFFIHSSIDGHLGCFHILATIDNAAMRIGVHIQFQISAFIFFSYIPINRIVGSYGNSIFNFLSNFQTVLHSGYTSLHSHKPCTGFPFLHFLLANTYFLSFL